MRGGRWGRGAGIRAARAGRGATGRALEGAGSEGARAATALGNEASERRHSSWIGLGFGNWPVKELNL